MRTDDWIVPDGVDPERHRREQLVREWRQTRRVRARQRKVLVSVPIVPIRTSSMAAEVLDYLDELHANTELALALDLQEHGPIRMDGKVYEHWHDGSCHRVNVRPLEPLEADGTAVLNCAEAVD